MIDELQWDDIETENEFLFGQMIDMAFSEDTLENEQMRGILYNNPTLQLYFDVDKFKLDLFKKGYVIVQGKKGFAVYGK